MVVTGRRRRPSKSSHGWRWGCGGTGGGGEILGLERVSGQLLKNGLVGLKVLCLPHSGLGSEPGPAPRRKQLLALSKERVLYMVAYQNVVEIVY